MRKNYFFRLAFLALLSLSGSSWLSGQVLFDNGPFFNRTGTGANGANESVLLTTTFGMGTIGFGHQATAFNRVADDFVIPNCHWRIDSIVFFGYQTGSTTTSTFTGVNFRIWNGVPDAVGSSVVFGDTTTNRLTRSVFSGAYRITETTTGNAQRPIMRNVCALPNLNLSTGTYWIDWSSLGSLASGPWAPPRTPLNLAITGNGRQRTGSTWNNALDGGTNTPAQGFPFIIYGTILDPVADAGADLLICPGTSATLGGAPSGSGGQGTLSFTWTNGGSLNDSTLANPLATPAGTTTYILSVSDTSGCVIADTMTLTVGATASSFLIGDTTICSSSTVTIDAGAGTSYLWSTGDTTQTITVGAGVYDVAVDNGSGCLSVDTVVVTAAPTVTILGNGTFCQQLGDTLTADLSPGSYLWSVGATTQSIIVNSSGVYFVYYADLNGCTSVDSFAVVALPSPTAGFSFTPGPGGLAYNFSDNSTGGPTSYFWSFGDGDTSSTASPSHTYANSGSYTVTLIVSNSCGSDTITQSLTVTSAPDGLASFTVSLLPNPAHDRFSFVVNGNTSTTMGVELMDVQGRLVQSWKMDGLGATVSKTVDVSALSKGVYMVRVSTEQGVAMRKLVIE